MPQPSRLATGPEPRLRALLRSLVAAALMLMLLMAACGLPVAAAQTTLDAATAERRVKAAYLYKFAGYVDWPDSAFAQADSPIVIAVLGNDKMADELAQLAGARLVAGRAMDVRRVKEGDPLAGAHILFVDQARIGRLAEPLATLPPRSMLVVTESSGALALGSVINFALVAGNVRFEISLEAAERRGLKLSSRLIGVAQNVQGRTR